MGGVPAGGSPAMGATGPVPVTAPTGSRPAPPVALYVHVPFCLSLCPYCDFVVYTGRTARGPGASVPAFVAALGEELRLRAAALDRALGARPPLASVYLGGGTPSLLPAATVADLLDGVRRHFGIAADAEVTLEANPGPDERGDLAGFVAAGVTRLSLGVQSMDPGELRRLGRRHSPADVHAALAQARRAGFDSVSVDLLYDLPGQTLETWRASLGAVLDAGADHVSAYALTLDDPDAEGWTGPLGDHLPTRPGARAWRTRARAEQDEDRAADQYILADELLAERGLVWYELSNWARPGHESRHNLAYWRHLAYEAVGPGAHAFDGCSLRRWNAARLDGYLAALAPGSGPARDAPPRLPPGGEEQLDAATFAAEEAILGLRLREGIGPDVAARPAVAEALGWARGQGLLEDAAGQVRLSLRGRLLSNEVLARIV
ncbi:MAG: radical SAM family heme chaperone HemW [Candidatus Limnocylindrales bacterium]